MDTPPGISPKDLETIRAWAGKEPDPLTLPVQTADSPQSKSLLDYALALEDLVSRLGIKKVSAHLDSDPPALAVRPNMHYLAIPDGPKLQAFLDSLAGRHRESLAPAVQERLKALELHARLDIFIAPGCPFCPRTIEQMIPLAFSDRPVMLRVIDSAMFPEMAADHDIRSVPTVILDGQLRWTGTIDTAEIVNVMVDRDPSALGPETLRGIIESGNAGEIARMMAAHGSIFQGLCRLLVHEKWPVRLGAMVTMEAWQELAPASAASAAGELWHLYGGADDTVKGDLIYTIGVVGDGHQEAALQELIRTSLPPELQEAAADAIHTIRTRMTATAGSNS